MDGTRAVAPDPTLDQRIVLRRRQSGTDIVINVDISESQQQLAKGSVFLPIWVESEQPESFCGNAVARVADGPDQPPRIWAADCEQLLVNVDGVNGFWAVPAMDGDEEWCLLLCDLRSCTCAIAVARVDGKQKGFRDEDVHNFLSCARRMFHDSAMMKTVIGHAICGADEAEIEWKVYYPLNEEEQN